MNTTMDMNLILYETLLWSPGMAENVRLDMRVSRKALLLLATAVDNQLTTTKPENGNMISYFEEQTLEELQKLLGMYLKRRNYPFGRQIKTRRSQ